MPYTAEISRANPSCIVFMVDQSGSMSDPFGAGEVAKTKAEGVADAINRLLDNLVMRCARGEMLKDFYHVAVIGYGSSVGSAYSGILSGRELVKISEIADHPAEIQVRTQAVEDGMGGIIHEDRKFKVWFTPLANGGTPMCQAFGVVKGIVEPWAADHMQSFPPIVINITDGEATDGDPEPFAKVLTDISTSDGNVLLFNCHISSHKAAPIMYPNSESVLPDQHAYKLYGMSSILPEPMFREAQKERFPVSEGSRGFVFNAELVDLIRFIDMGTRPSNR